MFSKFLAALAILSGLWMMSTALQAQPLPATLQSSWQRTQVKLTDASIVVQEVGGGVPLVSINPDVPRNPASVMKLVTTWAGLTSLGADWRWRTALLADENADIDTHGRLAGPLYIRAGADPALTLEALWRLLRDLRLRGVTHLDEVVVDRSLFGEIAIDPDAFDASGDRPYNASPDAMMVTWGAVRVAFWADARAQQWRAVLDPPMPGVQVTGNLTWSAGACPRSPQYWVGVSTVNGQAQVGVSGSVPGACGNFDVYRLVQSQTEHFDGLFRMLWQELGGTLTASSLRSGQVPEQAQLLVWHDSPPLAEVIRAINKYSNNVMARMLLLTLGAQAQHGATAHSSAARVLGLLREQGIDTAHWHIANGSGLSRSARLTASGLTDLLALAWQSPLMPEFVSSLSIAGVDGTLKQRLRTEPVQGSAHLKTGTLRDAQALAGYVQASSGKRYIVVSLIHSANFDGVQQFHDALVGWVVRQ